jgi:hypothetical protein
VVIPCMSVVDSVFFVVCLCLIMQGALSYKVAYKVALRASMSALLHANASASSDGGSSLLDS